MRILTLRAIVVWLGKRSLRRRCGLMMDTKVRELANHLGFDPMVAQKLYFESDLFNSIDGPERIELEAALSAIKSLKRSLTKANNKLKQHGVLTAAFKYNGYDLLASMKDMEAGLTEITAFGEDKLKAETSGTKANKRAHAVAKYVAELFLAHDLNVGFGVQPLNANEPSTPYGRAVREALSIFKVYETPQSDFETLKIVNWKWPAQASAKALRNTKTNKK